MNQNEKTIVVIFGASGDLTSRKLIPSLFSLYVSKNISENFSIYGTTRSACTVEDFRKKMKDALLTDEQNDAASIDSFIEHVSCVTMDPANKDDYAVLQKALNGNCENMRVNVVYYYAVMPTLIEPITENLCKNNLLDESNGFKRAILEKPFGTNLQTAQLLNKNLLKYAKESQLYRIDHYMGKETVQNILVTRFANPIFEAIWNRLYIDRIEISLNEKLLVMHRGAYYDKSGALRDMLQNHLLQILALIAMDAPSKYDAISLRNEQLKVFESLRPMPKDDIDSFVVRGQYKGYTESDGVENDSTTETFVAIKTFVDSYRFKDVPFYLRTGKGLRHSVAEVVITFKNNALNIFGSSSEIGNNQLIIRIQPDEGILLKLDMKVPGKGFETQKVNLGFHYAELPSGTAIPQAYERLLHDCMIGDASLFQRGDCVEETWKYVQPILDHFEKQKDRNLYTYPIGSEGPKEAESILEDESHTFRQSCANLKDDGQLCSL